MINTIIGIKTGQTQQFTETGERFPVTNILVDDLSVIQVKTTEKDGYNALQLGIGFKKENLISKQTLGRFKKAGLPAGKAGVKTYPRFLREIRANLSEIGENLKQGSEIKVEDVLKVGDVVDVMGISKGKGFAGGVKRHHFKGGPRTHGQSDRERAPGSIGATTTPGRVLKGKRMAGHMGSAEITVKNLKIVNIDPEKNILTIRGLVPGADNGVIMIKKV